jgi:aarF domain-containing kinase
VAVKVQYPLTERCFYSDLGNLSLSSRIVHWVFPQIDLDWIIRRFKNEIQKELNFVQEAQNSQEVASLFSKQTSLLKIPSIHWDLTTRRVLTMELIEGVKITDVAALRAIGINPRQVVRSLYEVFGEMIFCHGFFHADPHPGNIMVQPQSNVPLNFRIALLDHGLYRRLSPEFRQDFCQLWKALIPFNDQRLFSICKKMGVETHYRYFPLLISRSYWRSLKLVSLRELASLEVFRLVENASEDLMLVIKSFVHLHYIASDLGVNSFEVARVLAKFAFKGEAFWGPEAERKSAIRKYFGFYSKYIFFKLAVARKLFSEAICNLYYRLLSIEII